MKQKVILGALFLIGLFYILLPGPSSINDIAPLPNSLKSHEPGDTVQIPNIAAFFSNKRRDEVTTYYHNQFSYLQIFGIRVPAFRLNHPPEESYTFVRDQQPSTYLEQYGYPLRDVLYVNGFEPFDSTGKAYKRGATAIFIEGNFYDSKNTLRYYGSSNFVRIVIYTGIWASVYFLYIFTKSFLFKTEKTKGSRLDLDVFIQKNKKKSISKGAKRIFKKRTKIRS